MDKWPGTSVSEVYCCVYCFQLIDSFNSRAILWQILKQHPGRSCGQAQILSIFHMLINSHDQPKGGHISETMHHRHQVLYIFGILGFWPPASCIQMTIWSPQGPPGTPKLPKPHIWNYPPQTPSVIYFWNPWVQTYTLLHSDHHLIRMVQWPDTPAVRFLALRNFCIVF